MKLARKHWNVFSAHMYKNTDKKESRLYHLSIATFARQSTSNVERYGTNNFSYVETKSQSLYFSYREIIKLHFYLILFYFFKFFEGRYWDNLYLEKSGCSWWNRKRERLCQKRIVHTEIAHTECRNSESLLLTSVTKIGRKMRHLLLTKLNRCIINWSV